MTTSNPDPADPYGAILSRLASQGIRIAARLEDRVMTAETAAEEANAAMTWTKVARGLRQTLLLDAKLTRERQAFRRDFGPQMERDHAQLVARRRAEVHDAIQNEIYNEYERSEDRETCGHLIGDLFDILDDEAEKPAFLNEPVRQQIDRIRHVMGLGEFAEADEDEGETPEADDPAAPDTIAADPPADRPVTDRSGPIPRVFTVEPRRPWAPLGARSADSS